MAFRWIGKSADGNTVTLNKLEGCPVKLAPYATAEWLNNNSDLVRTACVLDVETTGLNQNEAAIIEIGIRQFQFNRNTGEILNLGSTYSSFQDPGFTIDPFITEITGITNEMVVNKSIDWKTVDCLLEEATIIIAHNAKFDRPFIDKKSKLSATKIWACSLKQIDWTAKGFTSSKLELLNIYHGFFTDSHRAINDVEALLYLISLSDDSTDKPYLQELLNNARRPMTHVIATAAPFDAKEHLKSRGYNWDNTNRFWAKTIFKDEVLNEVNWLEERVYCGPFAGITRDIALSDGFKA